MLQVITTAPVISATTVVIRPRTYLVWSVLSLIWCPLIGIFALIYSLKVCFLSNGTNIILAALQVDSEWDAGRYGEAHSASRMARLLNLIGLICHVVVVTAIVIAIAVTA